MAKNTWDQQAEDRELFRKAALANIESVKLSWDRKKSDKKMIWLAVLALILGVPTTFFTVIQIRNYFEVQNHQSNHQTVSNYNQLQSALNSAKPHHTTGDIILRTTGYDTSYRSITRKYEEAKSLMRRNPRSAKVLLQQAREAAPGNIEVVRDYVIACEDIREEDESAGVPVDRANLEDLKYGMAQVDKITNGQARYRSMRKKTETTLPLLQEVLSQKG